MREVRISEDGLSLLESVEATLHFSAGKKIGIDYRRNRDGLRMQASAWHVDELLVVVAKAEHADRIGPAIEAALKGGSNG